MEQIYALLTARGLTLSSRSVRGKEIGWADALSRFSRTSVEWHLRHQVFQALMMLFGLPQVDLVAFQITTQLPFYLTFSQRS